MVRPDGKRGGAMKYSFESPVRFSEVDENAVMTIPALVNYFQDAASLQSEALGIGTEYLAKQGRGWLLLSWQIVIDHLPKIARRVRSTTWGYSFRQMMANRNFTLTGEEGELYAYANSQWMLFDFRKMRPVAVPEEEQRLYDPEEKLEMHYDPGKIRPEKEAQVIHLLSRMTFSNMTVFRFSRDERNRMLDVIINYYRLHNAAIGTLRSPDILKQLFI